MSEKLPIEYPIIVEGKYDKIKLDSLLDATVITTDGFGIFKAEDSREFLKKLSEKTKIIVLTDSDGAGLVIRNHIKSFISADRLIHLYTPMIEGKEKRKSAPSKAGTLGVEGMEAELLRELFAPYSVGEKKTQAKITKMDLYDDGLLGQKSSSHKRKAMAKKIGLPDDLSSNAFLDAINLMIDIATYKELVKDGADI